MTKKKFRFRTTEPIIIPKWSFVTQAPSKIEFHTDHIEIVIGFGGDRTGHFLMDFDEAFELGLIEEDL